MLVVEEVADTARPAVAPRLPAGTRVMLGPVPAGIPSMYTALPAVGTASGGTIRQFRIPRNG